jgi:hypothetical protein
MARETRTNAMLPVPCKVVRQARPVCTVSELSALLQRVLGLGNLGGSQGLG